MANAILEQWKEQLIQGGSNTSLAGTVKAALIDLDDVAVTITAATNATPIVITATSHGLSTGQLVSISGVTGNTNANGIRRVTVTDANTYSLQDPLTGANIAGNGTFGGTTPRSVALGTAAREFYSSGAGSWANATVGTPQTIGATKSYTRGVFDGADVTFTAVLGDVCEAVIIYIDTGSAATSRVVAFFDENVTGLPVTPNGGDITITWNASGIFGI